jgi:hypothetical protein
LSPDQKRAKRQELQEMLDARFKTILTPEQFEHWQTLQGRRPPGQRAPLNPGAPSSEAPTNSAASH